MNVKSESPEDIPICTLGPEGTDSSSLAGRLSNNVQLFTSFPEAMKYAHDNSLLCLVACGYQKLNNGLLVDSWVNLNFRYTGKMRIKKLILADTKKMCLAVNKKVELRVDTCMLHPATIEFANKYCRDKKQVYVDSKPLAVKACAEGKCGYCIGSLDVVKRYKNLKILKKFTPQMAWALYYKL